VRSGRGRLVLVRAAVAPILLLGLVAADHAAAPAGSVHATLDVPPVQVLVSKNTKPGAVTYRYRVINGSAFEITSLLIGFNYFTNSPELRLAPLGWDGDRVPSTSARSPARWQFAVIQTEDDSLVNLAWEVDTLATGMLGGTNSSDFEVTLPAPPSSVFGRNGVKIGPNPAGEGVIIEFSTPAAEGCTIDVLDAKGRLVRRMFSPLANAGAQRAPWDGKDDKGGRVPPAVYFVRLQSPTMDWFAKFTLGR